MGLRGGEVVSCEAHKLFVAQSSNALWKNSLNCWEAHKGNQQPRSSKTTRFRDYNGNFLLFKKEDGIVHSIWKQIANIKEPRDVSAILAPATRYFRPV